jgi:hypothetical protein
MRVRRSLLLASLAVASLGTPPALAKDWAEVRKEFKELARATEWEKRRRGYLAIRMTDSEDAADEVLSALSRERHGLVVAAGIDTLSGYQSEGATKALADAARSGRGTRRSSALLALRDQKGTGGKEALLAILDQNDAWAVGHAAAALGAKQVVEAAPRLASLLAHKDWQVRSAAAGALGRLGPAAPKDVLPALAAALEASDGADRGALAAALESITKKDFGYDPAAWKRLAGGEDAAKIARAPKAVPYVLGVPVYGRRVVLVLDHSVGSDDPHPFDQARLKQVCEVPNARPILWITLRTRGQLMGAAARRLFQDMPPGSSFELIAAGRQVRPLFGKFSPAGAGSEQAAAKAIEDAQPENGLDAYGALQAALDTGGKAASWTSGPDTVIYLSCGVPWQAEVVDAAQVGAEIGLEARRRFVPVHAVGVGNHPFQMCRDLASRTGGTYVDLSK